MSIDVRNMFRKIAPEQDKSFEQNPPYRKPLRERLEAARNNDCSINKVSEYDILKLK